MLLTDVNGPMSLKPRPAGSGRISRAVRFAAATILLLSFATFSATISRAHNQQDQSVAEAARKERARKQELQKRAKHIYTEEDLKHPNILTPEDRAQIEAERNECAEKNNCSPAPTQNLPASLDANSPAPGSSLGEVARQLRKQKELQALKPKQTEPFHLPSSTPALASPILPERPVIRPPAQPVLRPNTSSPKTPSNVFRRDPFAAVPVRPEVRKPEILRPEIHPRVAEHVRPEVHAHVHSSLGENLRPTVRPNVRPDFRKDVRPILRAHDRPRPPVRPRVSTPLAQPSILLQPVRPPALPKLAQPVIPMPSIRPATAQPVTKVATKKTVRAQRGDSLWKVARENLGAGNRWPELLSVNPTIADPNQILFGAQLNIPVVAATSASRRKASSSGGRTITVHRGDTLWNLAKANLGRSAYWPCLAAANPSIAEPNRIFENQELIVPSACTP
jgi:nucleoid-associated protein YgaU